MEWPWRARCWFGACHGEVLENEGRYEGVRSAFGTAL
jgi:hypothetical protein